MVVIKKMIVTSLGTGCLPVAPGTWASALTTAIATGIAVLASPTHAAWISGAAGILCFVLSLTLAPYSERIFESEDPPPHVIDESSGQFIALSIGYAFTAQPTGALWVSAAGFILFRFFDIVKPPPVRQLDKIHGGWGISLDDAAAGVLAGLCTAGLLRIIG